MAFEGLGIAANVFAVVDISAKVIGWCARYAQDVSHAKEDKKRLAEEVARLNLASVSVRELLHGPHGSRLKASHALYLATIDSQSQLRHIERLLTSGRGQSRASFEDLRWPFKSKDLQPLIQDLQRCTKAMYSALEADQTLVLLSRFMMDPTNEIFSSILLDMEHRVALDRLPVAEGASFDSHAEGHNPTCLENTRVELLEDVYRWIDDPHSKTLFWLNGMAGTGKSTISRTIARMRREHGDLGASFFFKRGEADRGNLVKFVPTLARQLAWSVPGAASVIKNTIDGDPAIAGKAVREQFDKLIREPLSKASKATTSRSSLVIVIDALDECERDSDIRLLINILSHTEILRTRLRVFLTSRPELPIRLGFSEAKGSYQDLVLHEMPTQIVEHDISAFLADEFGKIHHSFNMTVGDERKLPSDWPGQQTLQDLTRMAIPLFIFAATVCRFIGDRKCGSPSIQLRKVLDHRSKSHGSQLDLTYGPVLRSQITDVSEDDREQIIKDFSVIVGSIVVLASPLSVMALSQLLEVSPDVVDDRLDGLHSVLSIPPTRALPMRLLHLSFRDYLVDPNQKRTNKFWVDEELAHRRLASKCLRVMRVALRENICGLLFPGMCRSTVDYLQFEKCLPPEVQYACLYWVHHQTQVEVDQKDSDEVYDFLTTHFLHWLETLSLMGRMGEGLASLRSLVRRSFENKIPSWLSLWPHAKENWDACLSVLEGHSSLVISVAFSPDSKIVASASGDKTVRIWNVETGECEQVLEGHIDSVKSVVFSHDSKVIASASSDKTVRIWDIATGKCEQVLEGHINSVTSVVFSHDSKVMASASFDKTVRIWSVETGKCEQVLEGHSRLVYSVVFSHDSKVVASASGDKTVRVWNVVTGKCEQV